jgi:sulfonate transport system substrate-binding protein
MGLFTLLWSVTLGCAPSETPAPAAPGKAEPARSAAASAPAPGPEEPIHVSRSPTGEGLTPLRIGWQTTWATQGQLVAVLLHTDILAKNGFSAEFKGFPYGGPLNEGALAGAVDVILTADQPALSLAAKAPSWGIVGRLMYNRVGTFVPVASPIRTPKDLAGKKLAVPFGAAAQREAMEAAQAAGLDPKKDLTLVNLGVEEILGVVRAGPREGRWGELDAAAAWDPTLAEVEYNKRGRTIQSSTVTSVVVMDDTFSQANPGADSRFMTALAMAYDLYRVDPARADRWYQQAVKLRFNLSVLSVAAEVEPNLKAQSAADLRVHLTPEDVTGLREASAFMTDAGLLKAPLDVATVLRPSATTPVAPVDTSGITVRP